MAVRRSLTPDGSARFSASVRRSRSGRRALERTRSRHIGGIHRSDGRHHSYSRTPSTRRRRDWGRAGRRLGIASVRARTSALPNIRTPVRGWCYRLGVSEGSGHAGRGTPREEVGGVPYSRPEWASHCWYSASHCAMSHSSSSMSGSTPATRAWFRGGFRDTRRDEPVCSFRRNSM